ncbi:MAG: hypothetical protein K6G52_03545 [Treponemataceae bacterium]|nr:hypothetical protein [Treponemataceae bacterium]
MLEHKNHSEGFEGLSFADQARSLNTTILNLEKEILAHKRRSAQENKEDSTFKYIEQLKNLIERLN